MQPTSPDPPPGPPLGSPLGSPLDRRVVLARLGAGGLAVAAGTSMLSLPAAADDEAHPDTRLLSLAVSMESALVELLEAGAGHDAVEPGVADVLTRFAGHHREHATAFSTLVGDPTPTPAHTRLLDRFRPEIDDAADQATVLAAVLDLEEVAAATHLVALGALRQPAPVAATAATLPVEAAHAVVLARALALPPQRWAPSTQPLAGALAPIEEEQ